MPEDWEPGTKAVFAYKNPKSPQDHILMRIRELPNNNLEVQMMDTHDSSSNEIKLESIIKMIEKHENYNNLDAWLPKTPFLAQYKKDVLCKILDLPADEVK